ncbi:SPOR domain-containing protein [Aquabacterium sp. NJ1]|uniref:SPOR domain-containing protein n=1 Tax=Aquabacterium sp. NJ1 TaxID=1538295 RepID=UPI00126A5426|nr:SPOR domain-containing protein [Aquabacterium sp. NJ1]
MSLSPSDVEATRARARRRLVGMVVLVAAGLIGFPWLFETQPRSMSSDVQIVQAGGDANGEVQISGAVPARSPRSVAGRVAVSGIVAPPAPAEQDAPPAPSAGKPPVEEVVDEPAPRVASRPVAASKPAAKAVAKPADKLASKPAEKPAAKSTDKPAAKTPAKEPARDAAKDKPKEAAKSNDKPADKDKASTRYVVQFGAFADANTAHEARMKIERLGVKTYAQQVDTPAGKRIRVRMGPYTDKAEAEKAMATLRKAGLTGALLTL